MDLQKKSRNMNKKIDVDHIYYYLKTNELPIDKGYEDKRRRFHFKLRAADFILENYKLYYVRPRNPHRQENRIPQKKLVLFSNEDKLLGFYQFHINNKGEHHGKNKTSQLFAEHYYVANLFDMIDRLIKNCPVCCTRTGNERQEEDIYILNQLYGEKHVNHVLCTEQYSHAEMSNMSHYEGTDDNSSTGNKSSRIPSIPIYNEMIIETQTHLRESNLHDLGAESPDIEQIFEGADQSPVDIKNSDKHCENQELNFVEHSKYQKDQFENKNKILDHFMRSSNGKPSKGENETILTKVQSVEVEKPDNIWHSVEVCVFGPYDFSNIQKYVLVFIDMYSMWPEVMVVDTVTPTVVTMALLNLVCRYNLMTKLYLRESSNLQISSYTPDTTLLAVAGLHVDIIQSCMDYTDNLWTVMRDHISGFIANNTDWPLSLSFALIPLRMTQQEDGSVFLHTCSERQQTDGEDIKKNIHALRDYQEKLLKAYRTCASTSKKSVSINRKGNLPIQNEAVVIPETKLHQDVETFDITPRNRDLTISPDKFKITSDNNIIQKHNSDMRHTEKNKQISYVYKNDETAEKVTSIEKIECNKAIDTLGYQMTTRSSRKKFNVKTDVPEGHTVPKHTKVTGSRVPRKEEQKTVKTCEPIVNMLSANKTVISGAECFKAFPKTSYNLRAVKNKRHFNLGETAVGHTKVMKISDSQSGQRAEGTIEEDQQRKGNINGITKTELSCARCNLNFKNLSGFKYHMKSHFPTQRIKCGLCFKSCQNLKALKLHRRKSHGIGIEYPSSAEIYTCQICQKVFKTRILLSAHKRYHKDTSVSLCFICGKGVKKHSLDAHIKLHTKVNRIECRQCFRGFSTEDALDTHMKFKHSNVRPRVECPICKQLYTRKESMERHYRSQHQNIKPFMCDKCGKCFYRKQYLQIHQAVCVSGGQKEENVKTMSARPIKAKKSTFIESDHTQCGLTIQPLSNNKNAAHGIDQTNDEDKSEINMDLTNCESLSQNFIVQNENETGNVFIQNGNVLLENENEIVLQMSDFPEGQEVTHCVMYETESGVEYHILSDTPGDTLNTDTIAALEMLSQMEKPTQ